MAYTNDSFLKAVEEHFDFIASRVDLKSSPVGYMVFEMQMRVGLNGKTAVVDIETSGFAPYGSMVTFGVVKGDRMLIFQRLSSTPEARGYFKDKILTELVELDGMDVFAFCHSFEKGFLGDKVKWRELQPACGGKKDEVVKFKHTHFGEGKDVPVWWKSWKKTKDIEYIRNIIVHNANCLVKEVAILLASEENSF